MTPEQRAEALAHRRLKSHPWHSPPLRNWGDRAYHVSAACFEHKPIIGMSLERLSGWEALLLATFEKHAKRIVAWCVLPNHYHILVETAEIDKVLGEIKYLHGRSAYEWNGQDRTRGRQVWFNYTERAIRSERHFGATLNYVHHNPVHHGYCRKWQEWPFSSASRFLEDVGREEAARIWRAYPILDYGKGWDDPDM